MKKTTILIADDHSIVRMGISALLGYQPGFKVVGDDHARKKWRGVDEG